MDTNNILRTYLSVFLRNLNAKYDNESSTYKYKMCIPTTQYNIIINMYIIK